MEQTAEQPPQACSPAHCLDNGILAGRVVFMAVFAYYALFTARVPFIIEDKIAWLDPSYPLWRLLADSFNILLGPADFPQELRNPVLLAYRPGEFFILHLIKAIGGTAPELYRLAKSVTAALIAAVAAGYTTRSTGKLWAGIAAGALIAGSPGIWFSSFIVSDFEPVSQLMILAELYLFRRMCQTGNRKTRVMLTVLITLMFVFGMKVKETHALAIPAILSAAIFMGEYRRGLSLAVPLGLIAILPAMSGGWNTGFARDTATAESLRPSLAWNTANATTYIKLAIYHHGASLAVILAGLTAGNRFAMMWLASAFILLGFSPSIDGRYIAAFELPLAITAATALGHSAGWRRYGAGLLIAVNIAAGGYTSLMTRSVYGSMTEAYAKASAELESNGLADIVIYSSREQNPYLFSMSGGIDVFRRGVDLFIRDAGGNPVFAGPEGGKIDAIYFAAPSLAFGTKTGLKSAATFSGETGAWAEYVLKRLDAIYIDWQLVYPLKNPKSTADPFAPLGWRPWYFSAGDYAPFNFPVMLYLYRLENRMEIGEALAY